MLVEPPNMVPAGIVVEQYLVRVGVRVKGWFEPPGMVPAGIVVEQYHFRLQRKSRRSAMPTYLGWG